MTVYYDLSCDMENIVYTCGVYCKMSPLICEGKNHQFLLFQKEGKMRKAYDNDEDMFIYILLKEEYMSHDWCRS